LRSNQRLEALTQETLGQVNLGTYLEIPPGITLEMIQELVQGSIDAQEKENPNMENLISFLEYTSKKKIPVVILEVPHASGLPESTFYKKVREEYKKISTFNQLIELEHGKIGSETRNVYEEKSQMFIISEMLKEARKEAKLTQEELAERTGTKKSYISRIENGKGNIQLSTLIRIFEIGLQKRIGFTFL
jgi:DNA-binding XRE family transcriptional regulator